MATGTADRFIFHNPRPFLDRFCLLPQGRGHQVINGKTALTAVDMARRAVDTAKNSGHGRIAMP